MMYRTRAALALMMDAHAEHYDLAGEPFFWHPLRVMVRLGPNATEDERQVALLHDLLEGGHATKKVLIKLGFGAAVVGAVDLMSRPPGSTYFGYIHKLLRAGDMLPLRVKASDLADNTAPGRVAMLPPDKAGLERRYHKAISMLGADYPGIMETVMTGDLHPMDVVTCMPPDLVDILRRYPQFSLREAA